MQNENDIHEQSDFGGAEGCAGLGLCGILIVKIGVLVAKFGKVAKVASVATVATVASRTDDVADVGKLAFQGGKAEDAIVGSRIAGQLDDINPVDELRFSDTSIENSKRVARNKELPRTNDGVSRFVPSNLYDDVRTLSADDLTAEEVRYFTTARTYKVSHFVSIPKDNKEYRSIFSRDPVFGEMKKAEVNRMRLLEIEDVSLANAKDGTSQIRSFISESDSEYVTLVGHNNSGLFLLPNGQGVKVRKIADMCVEFGKRCIFLSCRSRSFLDVADTTNIGVAEDLTYSDAEKLIVDIQKHSKLSESGEISYEDFSLFITNQIDPSLSKIQARNALEFYVKRGGKTAAIGGLAFKLATKRKKRSDPNEQARSNS